MRDGAPPRTLNINVWAGMADGSEVALEKMDEAFRRQADSARQTIEELILIAARISRYGVNMRLKPTSMLNLALHVFRTNPSVDNAVQQNRIASVADLNVLLSTIYSTPQMVDQYLNAVKHPRHKDREDATTFMVRCLTAYAHVAWYVQLPEVVAGIVHALPMALWLESAPSLHEELKALHEQPDLKRLGELYSRHDAQFRSLAQTYFDTGRRAHRLVSAGEKAGPPASSTSGTRVVREEADSRERGTRGREMRTRSHDRGRKRSPQSSSSSSVASKDKRARDDTKKKGGSSEPKCYACQAVGHIAPNCTDAKKKAEYEAKKKADGKAGAKGKQ